MQQGYCLVSKFQAGELKGREETLLHSYLGTNFLSSLALPSSTCVMEGQCGFGRKTIEDHVRDFVARRGNDEHHFFLVYRLALITEALQGCLGSTAFLVPGRKVKSFWWNIQCYLWVPQSKAGLQGDKNDQRSHTLCLCFALFPGLLSRQGPPPCPGPWVTC